MEKPVYNNGQEASVGDYARPEAVVAEPLRVDALIWDGIRWFAGERKSLLNRHSFSRVAPLTEVAGRVEDFDSNEEMADPEVRIARRFNRIW